MVGLKSGGAAREPCMPCRMWHRLGVRRGHGTPVRVRRFPVAWAVGGAATPRKPNS